MLLNSFWYMINAGTEKRLKQEIAQKTLGNYFWEKATPFTNCQKHQMYPYHGPLFRNLFHQKLCFQLYQVQQNTSDNGIWKGAVLCFIIWLHLLLWNDIHHGGQTHGGHLHFTQIGIRIILVNLLCCFIHKDK